MKQRMARATVWFGVVPALASPILPFEVRVSNFSSCLVIGGDTLPAKAGAARPQNGSIFFIHPSGTRGEKLSNSLTIGFWKPKGSSTVTSQG